ncbi:MAG: helix-turn-helix domain-containing protein [Candidatus Hydrogenedentota bacterium]
MQIELTEKEKAELRRYHRTIKDGKKRDRIKAILLLDEGYSVTEISHILLIEENTVKSLSSNYAKNGKEI